MGPNFEVVSKCLCGGTDENHKIRLDNLSMGLLLMKHKPRAWNWEHYKTDCPCSI